MASMSIWTTLAELFSPAAPAQPALAGAGVPGDRRLPIAFTAAVIALSAKMAKADGVVVGVEVDAFHRAFRVEPREARNVDRLFDLAKRDTAGFESYADQIARTVHGNKALLRDVLGSLFHIATADRVLHPAEDAFLATVAARFGFTASEFRHERAQFVVDPDDPYSVLGLTPQASDAEVKQRHRDLVRATHPDVLTGRGMPIEMIDVATRKLAAINDAYGVITRERGL